MKRSRAHDPESYASPRSKRSIGHTFDDPAAGYPPFDCDYRRPADITQVGYYIPANGSTWAAYWSPTDPQGEIVYTADAYRGVDVLRIEKGGIGGKKVKAPVPQTWFGLPTADAASFQAHPVYGFMCPILKPEVDTP